MSSTEQAFVKAFARRNRSHESSVPSAAVASPNRHGQNVEKREKREAVVEEPSLDHRVADTAQIWIDSANDQVVRADHAEPSVPRPHVEPEPQRKPASPLASPAETHQTFVFAAPLTETNALIAEDVHDTVSSALTSEAASLDPVYRLAKVISKSPSNTAPAALEVTAAPESFVGPQVSPKIPAMPETPMATRAAASFQAAWEVDVFDVPKTVADLFFGESLFQDLSDRMKEAVEGGMRTMLVTSARSGEGRSSVAIGIALAAGASGARVALVDGDSDDPTLVDDLRLELESGWLDSLRTGLSVREVAVHAVEDKVTLIPLLSDGHTPPASADEVAQMLDTLRGKFDLIVIDGPAATSPSLKPFSKAIDSAIIVRDANRTSNQDVEDFASWLTQSGVQGVGMVENFAG